MTRGAKRRILCSGLSHNCGARKLAPQSGRHKELAEAVIEARKMERGVDAVAMASYLADKAAEELRPYQAALVQAAENRDAAEKQVTRSQGTGDQLGKALADAAARLRNPGTAPLGESAVIASPWRLLLEDRLDEAGIQVAAEIGKALCDLTAVTDEVTAEARAQLLGEQERDARGRALHLQNLGPGGIRAMPNPHNSSTPRPSDPVQYPPHPVQASTTPGWH